jgi:rSAM/selenodomain-associated transferase 1
MDSADSHGAPRGGDAVLVFLRAPELGRVKTRLAAAIGDAAALRIYRRLAEHAVAEALALAPAAAVRAHYTPADAREALEAWLGPHLQYIPQADGDLGERLARAFDEAFAAGHQRVVVIGSDLPDLASADIRQAFSLLEDHAAVLGPARDGGYWLLGLCAPLPEVFTDIPWSTSEVFALTVDRLRAAGITPALLAKRSDVDEAADLPVKWLEWARAM